MVILTVQEAGKEYGTDVILSGVSFRVQEGERIGIVGPNGAGKTTLLKMLAGELPNDMGQITLAGDVKMGYLHQSSEFASDKTLREEVAALFTHLYEMEEELRELSERISTSSGKERDALIRRQDELQEAYAAAGGYTYRSEMRGILTSMAFGEDRYDQPVSELSGGEKTRLALALLLLQKPDLLLLDEPTNHLDIGTLSWLEQYLKNYRGTLLIVSHDRYFLDQLVDRILDVDQGTVTSYRGNYTSYAEKKRLAREEQERQYEAYRREKERQEDLIRRYKQRGTEKLAKRARSREIKLEKMEEVAAPTGERKRMKIRFKERYHSGNDVLFAEDLSKSYGDALLFEHVDLDLKRGEKVFLVGANGIGKTTLLRILLGQIPRDSGRVVVGHNVKMAYYDQEQQLLNEDSTVLEELHDAYSSYTATELRTILGSFLFRGDDVFRKVSELSGGERARLSLLKLMMTGGNLLLLDEPTNHLDIESREVFEEALMAFPGTAVVISHDRYFLNKVPTRITELTGSGLVNYLGRYDYYTEKRQEVGSGREYLRQLAETEKERGNSQALRQQRKQEEAKRRREEREKQALEEEILTLEEEIASLEQEMCTEEALQDHVRLRSLDEEVRRKKEALSAAYETWGEML